MKKMIYTSLIVISFFVLESLIIYLFSVAESLIKNSDINIGQDFNFVFGITWFRIAIYFIPQLLLFILGLRLIKSDHAGFRLSIINLSSFILITVFFLGFITNDLKEFLGKPVTYYFIVATFSSPLIANKLPFLRSLIDNSSTSKYG